MDNSSSSHWDDLERIISRLGLITAHDALVLLHASFSAPKLQHIMCASPCYGIKYLLKFDELLRTATYKICNVSLSDDQWLLASFPVKSGGLGIRRVFTCITCFPSISCGHSWSPEPDFTYGYNHAWQRSWYMPNAMASTLWSTPCSRFTCKTTNLR